MPIVISGTNGISGVDGTASNPSYEGTDANTGVFFPAADTVAIGTNGTEALRVNSSQNVGIGVTPSAWGSNYKVLSSNTRGLTFAGGVDSGTIALNAYYDTVWRFAGTSSFKSARYDFYDGAHYWFSGNSGTAGNAITFTQVMQVDGGKSLALEGATSQTGTGITFPATQSASSNANTLDDYEEGTWTPQLRFGGASVGMTGTFSGRYTKVGNMVTIVVYVAVTNKGSSTGGAALVNLPFVPATTGAFAYATSFVYVQSGGIAPGAGTIVSPNLNGGTNVIDMNKYTIATGADANCTNGDFAAAGAFWFNATYIAA